MAKALTLAYIGLFAVWLLPYFIEVPRNVNLVGTAIFILYTGSHRSLKLLDSNVVKPEDRDCVTVEDAQKFPVIGSAVLFGLFLILKIIPKDLVNLLLSIYFSSIGTFSIAALIEPLTSPLGPLVYGSDKPREIGGVFDIWFVGPIPLVFTALELCCFAVSIPIAVIYFQTKHWLLNNLLAISFAVQGIEHLSLGSFKVGAILLSGLFLYDIFWVFGTDKLMTGESVMVTVAKGIDAPIKLLFPKELDSAALKDGLGTQTNFAGNLIEFSMLGLGDIVIPGFFIALLLRFDAAQASADVLSGAYAEFSKPYFTFNIVSYACGLCITVAVMEVFRAAQPALLYLVPACLGGALATAWIRRETKALFAYDEEVKEVTEGHISSTQASPEANKKEQ